MPTGNPYGTIPGPISLPPNLYSQTTAAIPGITAAGTGAANVIGGEVLGQVAPDVQRQIQSKVASSNVSSGMPDGGAGSFGSNSLAESLGLNSEQQAQQGVNSYLQFIQGVGSQMTDPNLAYQVADRNSIYASAPDPAAAAGLMQYNQNQSQSNARKPNAGITYGPTTAGTVSDWMGTGMTVPGQVAGGTGDAFFNDPGNAATTYGPGGGPGALDGSQYDANGNLMTPQSPASGSDWWSQYGGTSSYGNAAPSDPSATGDYFSSGQAYGDMGSIFGDTGA